MKTTTIAVSEDVKKKIGEFGSAGESYSDVLRRLVVIAKTIQLRDLLMSSDGCVPVRDALNRARKKWSK